MIEWIETTFNFSGGFAQTIAVILALFVVLLLFSLFVFVLRRLMGSKLPQSRSRQPRIAVMDSATVDTKRRLVLIRRDNIEHLLLIGGPSDVVVEQHIVRNAPLTSARPGAPVGTSQGIQAPMRTPTAPGPDIPLTPNDTQLSSEPQVPAAPAAQAPASPPQTPTPTPIASTPVSARATPAPEPEAAASVKAPPAPIAPVNPFKQDRVTRSAPDKESPGRAADLLRAATQNGFKRTKPKQDEVVSSQESMASAGSEPQPSAPAIKPEPATPEKQPTSKFRSLTRPFTARERPSYGTHSITPPASGPAARAKTALSAPVEAAKEAAKTEPSIDTPATGQPQPESGMDTTVAAQPQQETPNDSGSAASAETGLETSSTETQSSSGVSSASEPKDGDKPDVQASGEQTAPSSKPAQDAPAEAATKELNLELEVDDLIFDEGENDQDVASQQKDAPQVTNAQPGDASKDKSTEGPKAPEVNVTKTSGGGSKAPDVKAPGKSTAPATSLADKNPIEDEMAKILDELVGQPN